MEASPELRSNGKATIALILGVLAVACMLALAGSIVFGPEWMGGTDDFWLLLPLVSVAGGGAAALIGSLGWIDVRRGVTAEGLRQAQFGAILGGLALVGMVLIMAALIIFFLIVASAWNEGFD